MLLYENEEGLVRLQELLKLPKSFGGMGVRAGTGTGIVGPGTTKTHMQEHMPQLFQSFFFLLWTLQLID